MSDPFVGEIRAFGFTFAPYGWAFCDGRLLPIQQYTALFSLLGTNYGGNGQTNFALPNLQGSAVMGSGAGPGLTPRTVGEMVGSPTVTLLHSEMPMHIHILYGATPAVQQEIGPTPSNTSYFSQSSPNQAYATTMNSPVTFAPQALGVAGGSQPHNNLQPLLALNFCIALRGIFPARN